MCRGESWIDSHCQTRRHSGFVFMVQRTLGESHVGENRRGRLDNPGGVRKFIQRVLIVARADVLNRQIDIGIREVG